MIIIKGESGSGKSTAAMEMLKRAGGSSLYILMERDKRMIGALKEEEIDFEVFPRGFTMDIKCRILERGGLINNTLEFVVVDCLNMIRDNKTYGELSEIFVQMERDFKITVISTANILESSISDSSKKIADILAEAEKNPECTICRPEESYSIPLKVSSPSLL